jgi:hypothetical protein
MTTNGRMIAVWTAVGMMLVGASVRAEEKTSPNSAELLQALTEAGQPGPGHEKLQPLAGTWEFTCKFWMDPGQAPMESKGTIERRWVLGGRFLEEKTVATTLDGQPAYEGFGLIGYDTAREQYSATWACSTCTSSCTGTGKVDSSGRNFIFQSEAYCPLRKEVVKGREELRIETPDQTTATSYQTIDGKEVKLMEIVATRKQ